MKKLQFIEKKQCEQQISNAPKLFSVQVFIRLFFNDSE